jgi:hypothetical protein
MGVNVALHIEELVLHGFAPGDRHAIAEGLQQELAHLLAERGLAATLARGADVPKIGGLSFSMPAQARPERVGAQIAQSVWGGLGS